MNLHNLPPVDHPKRLVAYQNAHEDERRRVEAALAKAPKDRTKADHNIIAYSEYGTAARCHHP